MMKQMTRFGFTRPLWVILSIFLAALMASPTLTVAAGESPSVTTNTQDQEAKDILMNMAQFLAKATTFSVTLRSNYEAIQEDGQSIEFGAKRHILLQRPNRLRVETEGSDGNQRLLIFDGKKITAFKVDDDVFSQVEKAGTVDDALVYLVRDLQFNLPLARMFHTGFPQQIEKRLTSISYVEEDHLFGVVTDHLAFRTDDVDVQVWIAQGEEPLPRRVVITYKLAPGQPQFRGDFNDWSLKPKIAADSFAFTPPVGAEKIPLLINVRQKGSLPAQEGGRK